MSFWTRLTFFARPTEGAIQGPHRSGAIALRILGWTLLAAQAIGLILLPFTLPAIIAANEGTPGSAVGAVVGGIVGLIFGLGLMILWLWWLGWSTERWSEGDRRGLTHVRIIAILQIIFAAYGLLALLVLPLLTAALGTAPDYPGWYDVFMFANPTPYIILGACIAVLVLGKKADDRGAFAAS